MTDFIALYLPQYHPIPENDKWYGKGFTEWNNVAKAKPLYKGHYEPHIPADLGFYDLRLPEIRRQQAQMAQEYGVSAFCYWTYWFGNGKTLLDMPIWEVYKDNSITLPFCLGWANHTWYKKTWNQDEKKEVIVEQKYLGQSDYEDFFYRMLPLFRDKRYYRTKDGKLFFIVFSVVDNKDQIKEFIKVWRNLSKKEGIGDFYFVAKDTACRFKERVLPIGFDAVYDDNVFNIHHNLSLFKKVNLLLKRKIFKIPTVFRYKEAIKYMITEDSKRDDVIPLIAPNWDHSPRSGANSINLKECEPRYFEELVKKSLEVSKTKSEDRRIVLIKSWNEWGEGNHMEPDQKYGRGYLVALKSAIEKYD